MNYSTDNVAYDLFKVFEDPLMSTNSHLTGVSHSHLALWLLWGLTVSSLLLLLSFLRWLRGSGDTGSPGH